MIAIAIASMNLFVYCYFGAFATDHYQRLADVLYNSEWFHLENIYQKLFILMIGNAQRPLRYHGFHIAYLNLETFAKVQLSSTLFHYDN